MVALLIGLICGRLRDCEWRLNCRGRCDRMPPGALVLNEKALGWCYLQLAALASLVDGSGHPSRRPIGHVLLTGKHAPRQNPSHQSHSKTQGTRVQSFQAWGQRGCDYKSSCRGVGRQSAVVVWIEKGSGVCSITVFCRMHAHANFWEESCNYLTCDGLVLLQFIFNGF